MTFGDPFEPSPLEAELHAERGRALRVSVAALEDALRDLRDAEATAAASPSEAHEAVRADRFAEAAERLWSLVVHREALGLHRHEDVFEFLQVPRAVRLRMGPRARGRERVARP